MLDKNQCQDVEFHIACWSFCPPDMNNNPQPNNLRFWVLVLSYME